MLLDSNDVELNCVFLLDGKESDDDWEDLGEEILEDS